MAERRAGLFFLVCWLTGACALGVGPAGASAGRPDTSPRVRLGRLLFFDPVLSPDRRLACASCHRPERGLSDGRRRARGRVDRPGRRNTLSLYNVTVHRRFFRDARTGRLRRAVTEPLYSPDELGARPGALVGRLRGIREYRRRFREVYSVDTGAITRARVARALEAFVASLVSFDAPYDRYRGGDEDALTPAQKRGLKLFHSLRTRCFECHPPPDFTIDSPRNIGVPGEDGGVGEWTGDPARRGQFRVPTLRNVARTAPYMHNGRFGTLEEVVRFYADGAGRSFGADPRRLAREVGEFSLTDRQVSDLVAFLHALTDTTARPAVPEAVPSGGVPGGRKRGLSSREP